MRGIDRSVREFICPDEVSTRRVGSDLAGLLKAGDAVLLEGPLGAGKTTFVKGLLEGLGFQGAVRSPTFNLLQVFATVPPVLHVDLYRLPNASGLGIEDYLDTHLCLIEWPDRAHGLLLPELAWRVSIAFEGDGRRILIHPPLSP